MAARLPNLAGKWQAQVLSRMRFHSGALGLANSTDRCASASWPCWSGSRVDESLRLMPCGIPASKQAQAAQHDGKIVYGAGGWSSFNWLPLKLDETGRKLDDSMLHAGLRPNDCKWNLPSLNNHIGFTRVYKFQGWQFNLFAAAAGVWLHPSWSSTCIGGGSVDLRRG